MSARHLRTTLIMLCLATRTHDVPVISIPVFSTPANLVPRFPVLRFPFLRSQSAPLITGTTRHASSSK